MQTIRVAAVEVRDQISGLPEEELRRLGALLATQSQALELIARGAELETILETLCLLIERESPGAICSMLLVRDGCLRLGPGPNLPSAYGEGLDGLSIGEAMGSCGTAAFRREPVIVGDIASSPLWVEFRDFARCHGIAACWSIPVFDRRSEVVATFAISHEEPREPSRYQRELLHTASHLAGIAIDRQRADEQRQHLEQRLMHHQKLESLGLMAGGIAHDFNNLLTAIIGNLSLLELDATLSAKGRQRLDMATTAASSATALTTQMLTYAGLASIDVGEIDLAAEIKNTVGPLRASIRDDIALELDLSAAIVLRGDAGQLRQVVSNLVLNGADAIDDAAGTVRLALRTAELTSDPPTHDHTGEPIPPGRYLELEVADTGRGIPPDQLDRIFDPFFSSKRTGRGLGLAMVLGGARAHDAHLRVRSETGHGTSITVYFPESRWVERPTTITPSHPSTDATRSADGAERQPVLLVVEDHKAIRRLVAEVLEDQGWRVHKASDGLEGWRLWQELTGIDAVLLDRCMPGLGGDDLLRRIRAEDPRVPIVVTSGFGETSLAEMLPEGADAVLPKPFSVAQLLAVIRSLDLAPS